MANLFFHNSEKIRHCMLTLKGKIWVVFVTFKSDLCIAKWHCCTVCIIVLWLTIVWPNWTVPSLSFWMVWRPFYKNGLTSITAWKSYYGHCKVWDEITNPFPNFNDAAVEVWEGISNFIPPFSAHVASPFTSSRVNANYGTCQMAQHTAHDDKLIRVGKYTTRLHHNMTIILWNCFWKK